MRSNSYLFVTVEKDILAGVPRKDWVRTVKDNLREKFPDGVPVGNNEIKINSQTRREMTFSEYTKWLAKNDRSVYADKFRAAGYADEIILASRDYVNEGQKHARKDNIRDFARGSVLIRVGDTDYDADIVVGTTKGGEMLLYDIVNLKKTAIKERSRRTVQPNQMESHRSGASASHEDSISQNGENVNGLPVKQQFSFSENNKTRQHSSVDNLTKAAAGGFTQQGEVLEQLDEEARTYQSESMEETQARAQEWIANAGGTREAFNKLLNKRNWTARELTAAYELEAVLASNDFIEDAATLMKVGMERAADIGRAVNFAKIMQKNSPAGMLKWSEAVLADSSVKLSAAERQDIVTLSRALLQGNISGETFARVSAPTREWLWKLVDYLQNGDITWQQAEDYISAKAMSITTDKLPSTVVDKYHALQRISMLTNLKTNVRNVGGNVINLTGSEASRPMAYAFDLLLSKATGQRTTTAAGGYRTMFSGAKEAAKGVSIEHSLGLDIGDNKYTEQRTRKTGGAFQDKRNAKTRPRMSKKCLSNVCLSVKCLSVCGIFALRIIENVIIKAQEKSLPEHQI